MEKFANQIDIFADGANLSTIEKYSKLPWIKGFTTNPTLMRSAGVEDYKKFAQEALQIIGDKPISFEVLADDSDEILKQARVLASWAPNIYVKVPILNSRGEFNLETLVELNKSKIKLNVTAITTSQQVQELIPKLDDNTSIYLSVFAGRIADTGVDPEETVRDISSLSKSNPRIKIIWASPREVINILHAIRSSCHVITVTSGILDKIHLLNKNLDEYAIETSRMFRDDSILSGYSI